MAWYRTGEVPLTEIVITQFPNAYMPHKAKMYLVGSSSLNSWFGGIYAYHIWWYIFGDFSSGVLWQSVRGPKWTNAPFSTNPRQQCHYLHAKMALAYKLKIEYFNSLRPRQMDAISQTTVSNAFSWMKMFEFRLKFHWSLFPVVQWTIFQHWFR